MRDSCGRDITYLRLSVTDLCSFRCRYCMPAQGVPKRGNGDICSLEELAEIARAAVDCGPWSAGASWTSADRWPPFLGWRSCASPPTARPSPGWRGP